MVRLGDRRCARRGNPSLFLARAQTRLTRGVKGIRLPMPGITVTTLLTSVATASAQNIFEALFGQPFCSPVTVPDANFTARHR